MLRSNLDFIEHIRIECEFVAEHIDGISEEDFMVSEVLQRALARSLEIIGEATKNIDQEFQNKYPTIEWKPMARIRDLIIHHYFGVEYDIVWNIATVKLPVLLKELKKIQELEK